MEAPVSVTSMSSLIHVEVAAHSVGAAGAGLGAELRLLSPPRRRAAVVGTNGRRWQVS